MISLAVIMQRRRQVEPHDWQPISDASIIADMMNAWRREWISKNLTREQKQKADRDKASIFNAFLRRTNGGEKCVCAIWQTGASWMPPPGAPEHGWEWNRVHVMARFRVWFEPFCKFIEGAQLQTYNPHRAGTKRAYKGPACIYSRRSGSAELARRNQVEL